ncbi:hypothetical protein Sphch_3147 [Sphingobium chlorophenolicum L-1]|uniref:Uncharacterized protein n=1 Tax=Sphingobium chlorophenolicum L-1 TaxID=690566 RepID=F6F2V0_SPHCR|nr:hypothetical protein [Sphingobium chlorophenolicum]AEG50762.1 hypothetical protein Sphch_3147 [Sphingobium chlorophenolicum L-1]
MNFDKTARALATLDLSTEHSQLAVIDQETADTEAAYDRGQAKAADLGRDLAHILDARRNGETEAAALRAGVDIAAIVKTPDTIRGGREALLAGLRTLNADLDRLGKDRQAVRDRVALKLAEAFNGALVELDKESRNLAARLAQIFADAEAIRAASSSMAAIRLSTALRDVVDEAAVSNLISRGKPWPASPELADLLTQHKDAVSLAAGALHLQHRTMRM